MARLIDADDMREQWLENGENEFVYDTNAILDSIDAQPTVDAVEVVRCKGCKNRIYSDFDGCYVCHHGGFNAINPEHFCSYGERRTDG